MTAVTVQETLPLPGWSRSGRRPGERPSRRRPAAAVPVQRASVVLDPESATRSVVAALVTAGLRHQVSRVPSEAGYHGTGSVTSIALLRAGADPVAVHAALLGLPGAVSGHCGQASVSIVRPVIA